METLWIGIGMLGPLSIVSMFFLATRIEALGSRIDALDRRLDAEIDGRQRDRGLGRAS
jgi:hypothetical protein